MNLFVDKVLFLINNYNNLDNNDQLIIISILIILICFIYLIYIFFFIVAPSILDAVKDILPGRLKEFLIKFVNVNRRISVPFVLLSFFMILFGLFFAIFFLSTAVIFKSFINPL
jgi:predicted PurR-regulated permease PerM